MERRTQKVGITGKYGTRYGQKLRKQAKAIEILQRTKYTCTFCGKNSIRRSAVGIWKCRACRRCIAGGAWEFTTIAAQTARSTINRLKKDAIEVKKSNEEEAVEEEKKARGKKTEKKEKPATTTSTNKKKK
jgi:large subunit ribosomal protein L37Ae